MSFTKLLNKNCEVLEVSRDTNSIGAVTENYQTVRGTYKTRYEKMGMPKIIESGFDTNLDDYLFYFDAGVPVIRNDYLRVDGKMFDVKQVEQIDGAKSVHHIEVVATRRDHE